MNKNIIERAQHNSMARRARLEKGTSLLSSIALFVCMRKFVLKTKSKKKFNFLFACLNQRVQDSLPPPPYHASSSSSSSSSHVSFMSVTQQTTTDDTAPRPSLALRPIILAHARPSLRVLGYMQEEARRARDSSPRAGRGRNLRHSP